MTTNAKRQAAYKERMRKAGYQQVTVWIQPERAAIVKDFAEKLRNLKRGRSIWSVDCFNLP